MTRIHTLVLFSASLCALAFTGCGSSSAPPPPAFIAQANAICRRQLTQLDRLRRPRTPAQAVDYLPPALVILHHETRMLAAVDDAPPPDRDKLTAALADTRRLADMLERLLGELRDGVVEFATLANVQTQSAALRTSLDARFHEAGLTDCNE
jgi:hypothetical protein